MTPSRRRRMTTATFTIGALVIALVIACGVGVWASTHPDGLEYVAQTQGFLSAARESPTSAGPFADYALHVIAQPWLSAAAAGAVGCAATFGVAWGIGRIVGSRNGRS